MARHSKNKMKATNSSDYYHNKSYFKSQKSKGERNIHYKDSKGYSKKYQYQQMDQ